MAHVLLIDDDPLFIAEQVRLAFPNDAVTVAATGAEGIAAFRSKPPDVVLLDLHLPDRRDSRCSKRFGSWTLACR